jgi:hypothetical protein
LSLRLQRKALKVTSEAPTPARLTYGQDWLTKQYGTFPYSLNLWDVLKGIIFGGLSYGLLTATGKTKSLKTVAGLSFAIGSIGGLEQTLDEALAAAYGRTFCTETKDINPLIHELFQSIMFQGAVSAGFSTLLAAIFR